MKQINHGSELAKKRWAKEKPDPEYFKRIGKLGAKKRWAKKPLFHYPPEFEFPKGKESYCPRCYFEDEKVILRNNCPHKV